MIDEDAIPEDELIPDDPEADEIAARTTEWARGKSAEDFAHYEKHGTWPQPAEGDA